MNRSLFTILFIIIQSNIFCQGRKNLPIGDNKISFELNGFVSKIIKHNSKFKPNVTELTYGFELSASYKTFGSKNWQGILNYPEFGVSFLHSRLGNSDIFGNAYAVLPYVKFQLTRSKWLNFYIRLGAGLGYITKHYHPISNPINNVIGSPINTIVQFRIGTDFHLTKEIDLVIAGAFKHYSNSSTQAPNLGINLPMGIVGISYKPNKFYKEYNTEKNDEEFQKKNEYTLKFGIGIQDNVPRGPKFPVYSTSFQYGRLLGFAHKVVAGTTLSFSQYEYDFMRIQEINEDRNQTLSAMDLSVFGGYEILLGNVGINFLLGAYIYNDAFNGIPIYAKPGLTYYFTKFGRQESKPFIGINMKTHYFVAQFVEIHFGVAF